MKRDPLPKVVLFCTKDGSDKEYHLEIIEVQGGYSLKILNGKRGAAKEQKGEKPVLSFEDAVKNFDRIVKEKTSPKKVTRRISLVLAMRLTKLPGRCLEIYLIC